MTWEKDPHMQRFLAYDARVRNELIVYVNKYDYIETIYVRSPSEFNLYSQYCSVAHGNAFSGDIKIDKNYFRGDPDWYFLEKDKGDDDLDYYWLETLSEKKDKFNGYVKKLDDIVKGATCS